MLLKDQKGTAIFVAVMMLMLSTGLGLLAFQISSTELQISSYGKNDLAAGYLAEAGIEKILSWISQPAKSPNPVFFESLGPVKRVRCSGDQTHPDFQLSSALLDNTASGPFSELTEMGRILDLRLYRGEHPKGLCRVEVKAESGRGAIKIVRVELAKSPIQPMTAGIQGAGNAAAASPIWAHWGKIRYTDSAHLGNSISKIPMRNSIMIPNEQPYTEGGLNQDPWLEIRVEQRIEHPLSDRSSLNGDPNLLEEENRPYADRPNVYEKSAVSLDTVDLDDLKRYVKMYGIYYVVTPAGRLEQNGVDQGTFDQLFSSPASGHRLVWVDLVPGYSSSEPILMAQNHYKGHFYFTGNVQIKGNRQGETVQAQTPPWPSTTSQQVELTGINLDGFLYAIGEINLQGAFSAYGALFAGQGFTGPAANDLEVWYNHNYSSANYSGLSPVIRLKGTWHTLPVSDKTG